MTKETLNKMKIIDLKILNLKWNVECVLTTGIAKNLYLKCCHADIHTVSHASKTFTKTKNAGAQYSVLSVW